MFFPPRGMRDFLPEEMALREEILDVIRETYKKYGFLQIQTPALEYLSVLKAKCGEEVKYQIYEIEDMGLRFEFTASLARLISNISVPKPYKVFQIGPVWRRDEPQRGRYREFWQADIDIIGSESKKCEAEILACMSEVYNKLKIKHKIRINSIKILDKIIEKIDAKEFDQDIKRALDKLKKKGKKEVEAELVAKIPTSKVKELFSIIDKRKNGKIEEGLKEIEEKEVGEVIKFAKVYGLNNMEVDYSLARGLAYYTSTIFEFEAFEDMGSIGAGGRYDNLLEIFGQGSPAVGGSIGVDRVVDLIKEIKNKMENKKMKEKEKKEKEKKEKKQENERKGIYIANIGEETYDHAISIAKVLRDNNINCSLNLTDRNLRKQLDYANSMNFKYAIIIGKDEIKENKVKVKDLLTGKEEVLNIKDFIKKLKR
jgi:histidyl-tRNA synthetase